MKQKLPVEGFVNHVVVFTKCGAEETKAFERAKPYDEVNGTAKFFVAPSKTVRNQQKWCSEKVALLSKHFAGANAGIAEIRRKTGAQEIASIKSKARR